MFTIVQSILQYLFEFTIARDAWFTATSKYVFKSGVLTLKGDSTNSVYIHCLLLQWNRVTIVLSVEEAFFFEADKERWILRTWMTRGRRIFWDKRKYLKGGTLGHINGCTEDIVRSLGYPLKNFRLWKLKVVYITMLGWDPQWTVDQLLHFLWPPHIFILLQYR